MNLPDRIRAHVEELRSAPDIVVTTCDIGSGPPRELSADDVDLISDRWGADAVDGTRDYLLNTDRIHLSWHSVAHYVHGEFALTDIRSCMTGWIVEVEDERLAPGALTGCTQALTRGFVRSPSSFVTSESSFPSSASAFPGEHHNPPFFDSSPTTLLAVIAAVTKNIILSTSTTLITTNAPSHPMAISSRWSTSTASAMSTTGTGEPRTPSSAWAGSRTQPSARRTCMPSTARTSTTTRRHQDPPGGLGDRHPVRRGQPAGRHRQRLGFHDIFGNYQRQLWVVDNSGLPQSTVPKQIDSLAGEVIPVLRKEMAARLTPGVPEAPTHAEEVRAKYGDNPARQPRPIPNRGDNTTGTSPHQDSDTAKAAVHPAP